MTDYPAVSNLAQAAHRLPAAGPSSAPVTTERDGHRERDDILFHRLARGDRQALDDIYRHYATPLFSFAMKILGRREEAEEDLQDAFVRMWHKAAQFDPAKGRPYTWAVMIVRGLALDKRRSLGRQPAAVSIDFAPERSCDPAEIFPDEAYRPLREAMVHLRPEERECLELAVWHDLSHPQIAADLRQPLGTVKSRLRRALAKLRGHLQAPAP